VVTIPTSDDLCSLVQLFDAADWPAVRSVLRARRHEIVQRICAASTEHPLSFTHTALADCSGRTVRLHYWPLHDTAPDDFAIHTHHWHLRSFVLAGALRNDFYRVEPMASGDTEVYQVVYGDGGSRLAGTGEFVRCQLDAECLVAAGDAYDLPVGRFHATTVEGPEPALSVVVSGLRIDSPPTVLGTGEQPPPAARAHVSAELIAEAIAAFQRAVS
jgi:hypothetical protein